MHAISQLMQPYAMASYFVLTFGLFWLATPLARISPLLPGLVAALAPGVVATTLTALVSGRAGVRALVSKLSVWRVGWQWYAAALGLPVVVNLAIWGLSALLRAATPTDVAAVIPLIPIVMILAAGEELGWRGYVLPRWLARLPPLGAALGLGVVHALYHLPLWLAPGFPAPSYSFGSFLVTSLALGIVWVWLYQHTRGSVLIATLFHGAFNSAGYLFIAGVEPAYLTWLMPLLYGAAGLIIVALSGRRLARPPIASLNIAADQPAPP